jgi:hypothetical protein
LKRRNNFLQHVLLTFKNWAFRQLLYWWVLVGFHYKHNAWSSEGKQMYSCWYYFHPGGRQGSCRWKVRCRDMKLTTHFQVVPTAYTVTICTLIACPKSLSMVGETS